MCVGAAPIHSVWVVQQGFGVGHAFCLEEDHEVVVAEGSAQGLGRAAYAVRDSAAAGARGRVYNDGCADHIPSLPHPDGAEVLQAPSAGIADREGHICLPVPNGVAALPAPSLFRITAPVRWS